MSEIVEPLRFCGVVCIARSVSQGRRAQLTRCFSAVAELLVAVGDDNNKKRKGKERERKGTKSHKIVIFDVFCSLVERPPVK